MRTLVWLIVGAATLAGGCVRAYREPPPSEPHAIVRVRVVRHRWAGPLLDEAVRLNGYGIAMPPAGPHPSVRALRVRPEPTAWRFGTTFYHTEMRTRLETVQESYSCGTYNNPRTCTRSRTQTVTRTVNVTDAACRAQVAHTPIAGAAYLLQYEFYDHERCTVRCYRQLPGADGSFQLLPCGAGEPPATSSPSLDLSPPTPHSSVRARTSGGSNTGE